MSTSDPTGLRGVAVYNPDLLSKSELIAHFVARQALLTRLLEELRTASRTGNNQHHLLVGQRGMGKTTILRRLRYAVEDDPSLSSSWLPLVFPEEQYNVTRLSDFYMNCADALGDMLESRGDHRSAQALDDALATLPQDEASRARAAVSLLLDTSQRLNRRLLLLVDNVELILDRLESDQWAIRELLSANDRLLLIGATSEPLEATYQYDKAFYDFFRIHELVGLTEAETHTVLMNLSKQHRTTHVQRVLEEDPARIRSLHVLTGGNPRTVVLLYGVLAQDQGGDVRTDLEQLLDLCTPLYKARFEALPAQGQQIIDALALRWDPLSAADIATATRLDVNAVSSQLNRLSQQGVVEKVAYPPSSKTGFQIAERFFNIWYLMRASRRVRQRLIWLVQFLRLMYGGEELCRRARVHLQPHACSDSAAALRHAEFGLALAQAVEERPLRRALEADAIHGLVADRSLKAQLGTLVDLDGADAELRTHVEGAQWASELRQHVSAAHVSGAEWDAERLTLLLGGMPFLSRSKKTACAVHLSNASNSQVSRLIAVLESARKEAELALTSRLTNDLYLAISRGDMRDATDIEGAAAAAIPLNAPHLVTAAALLCLDRAEGEALVDLEPVILSEAARRPKDPLVWHANARWLHCMGRYTAAESVYKQAIGLAPELATAWRHLGLLYKDHLARPADAEAALVHATTIDNDYAGAWADLGRLLSHQHRRDDAVKAYRQAAKAQALNPERWIQLALCLETGVDGYDEAEDTYRRALDLDDDNSRAWSYLGSLLRLRGRTEEAETAFRRAVQTDPKNVLASTKLGLLLLDGDRFSDAESVFRTGIEIAPDNTLPWTGLGLVLSLMPDRFAEAEVALRKAMALDPKNVGAWRAFGFLLSDNTDRCDEAVAAHRMVLELEANDVETKVKLSRLLCRMKRYEEAEELLTAATEADDADPRTWYALSMLLHDTARYEEAERALQRVLKLTPDDSEALKTLATILSFHLARPEEAEMVLRKVVSAAPQDATAWIRLGTILRERGCWGDAELAFRKATEAQPDWSSPWNELAWHFYLARHRGEEAQTCAQRAISLSPDSLEAAHTLATVLTSRGMWERAVPHAITFLRNGSPEFYERHWPTIMMFFGEAVRTGVAHEAVELLDELELGERWRPLRVALEFIATRDESVLLRVAPEVRTPARELVRELETVGVGTGNDKQAPVPDKSAAHRPIAELRSGQARTPRRSRRRR